MSHGRAVFSQLHSRTLRPAASYQPAPTRRTPSQPNPPLFIFSILVAIRVGGGGGFYPHHPPSPPPPRRRAWQPISTTTSITWLFDLETQISKLYPRLIAHTLTKDLH